jgi:hypothetical protein
MWLNPWKSENEHILRIPIWSKSWERRVHESSSVGQSATVQRPIDLQKFHGTARVHLYWLVVSGLCDSAYMKPHEYTDSIPRSPSPATAVSLDRRTRSRRTCEIRAYPAANANLATCGTKTATRLIASRKSTHDYKLLPFARTHSTEVRAASRTARTNSLETSCLRACLFQVIKV